MLLHDDRGVPSAATAGELATGISVRVGLAPTGFKRFPKLSLHTQTPREEDLCRQWMHTYAALFHGHGHGSLCAGSLRA